MVYWCLGIFNDFLKALFNLVFIAGSCRNKTSIEFHHYLVVKVGLCWVFYLGLSAQLLRNVSIVTQTPPAKAKNLIFICTDQVLFLYFTISSAISLTRLPANALWLFLEIFVQKVFETNFNFQCQQVYFSKKVPLSFFDFLLVDV